MTRPLKISNRYKEKAALYRKMAKDWDSILDWY